MTPGALRAAAVFLSLVAAAWAAVLALAEQSPNVAKALVDAKTGSEPSAARYRMIHVSRLSLLLISAVTASLAAGWWTRPPAEAIGAVGIVGGFLYMVAEALPRAVSVLAPGLATAIAPIAVKSAVVFRPLHLLVSWVERLARRILPASRGTSAVDSARRDLLMGVFSLGDTTVSEIMTPRLDVTALDDKAAWGDVVDLVRRSEHARLPVYAGTLDQVVGVLHAKDLVPAVSGAATPPQRWHELVRSVEFVPETKTAAAQLHDFHTGASHLAVVVDEFGGTSGIVTLEDVLEEVVGEIHDEYDVDERPAIEREGDDKFWVDGVVTLDELNALLESDIEVNDVSTVGGLVYAELGRVPNPGDELRVGEFRVVVEQIARRRVRRVYFERLVEPESAGSEPES